MLCDERNTNDLCSHLIAGKGKHQQQQQPKSILRFLQPAHPASPPPALTPLRAPGNNNNTASNHTAINPVRQDSSAAAATQAECGSARTAADAISTPLQDTCAALPPACDKVNHAVNHDSCKPSPPPMCTPPFKPVNSSGTHAFVITAGLAESTPVHSQPPTRSAEDVESQLTATATYPAAASLMPRKRPRLHSHPSSNQEGREGALFTQPEAAPASPQAEPAVGVARSASLNPFHTVDGDRSAPSGSLLAARAIAGGDEHSAPHLFFALRPVKASGSVDHGALCSLHVPSLSRDQTIPQARHRLFTHAIQIVPSFTLADPPPLALPQSWQPSRASAPSAADRRALLRQKIMMEGEQSSWQ